MDLDDEGKKYKNDGLELVGRYCDDGRFQTQYLQAQVDQLNTELNNFNNCRN